jgi:hypothetical protein
MDHVEAHCKIDAQKKPHGMVYYNEFIGYLKAVRQSEWCTTPTVCGGKRQLHSQLHPDWELIPEAKQSR